jgi:Tfp pilus assembly protein FimT
MAAVVNLKVDNLAVEPGQTATGELSLANTGTIVEQFTILVLGDAAEWTQVEPPVVSLFPQGQQVVTLRFSPPRVHTTPSGFVEFAVKVIPSNEPEESVVEEGAINVGTFNDVGAELVPRVTTGRFSGRQRLAVDSRGNVPVPVTITAIDAAEALKFRVRPAMMTTAPGEARFSRLSVKPRQRFWRGRPQQKPYKVQVAAADEKPVVLDGGLTQKAVLPKWLLPLLAILALLLLLWFLVLRPIVKSTAVTASAAQLAAQAAQTRSLANQLAATKSQVAALSGAKPGATPPTTAAPGAPSTTAAGTTVAGSSTTAKPAAGSTTTKPGSSTTGATVAGGPTSFTGPNDGRLFVQPPPNNNATQAILIQPGNTLNVNDVILENNQVVGAGDGQAVPAGDYGTVRLQRILPPAAPGQPIVVQDLLVEDLSKLSPGVEFRFSSPMQFLAGQSIALQVFCGNGTASCNTSAYYNGPITKPGP